MQKIEFRARFQLLTFKNKPRRHFTVKLVAQDEEGNESRTEQTKITGQESTVDIGSLVPFELVMIAEEGRTFYMSHNLYFIVEKTPIISRRIPLHLSNIYDHYLTDSGGLPLDRVYAFQQGKIIYCVTISRCSKVTDEGEIAYYQQKFNRFPSLSSSRINKSISQSEITQGEKGSKMRKRPSFMIESGVDKLEGQETIELEDPDSSDREEGAKSYLQSWQLFSQMERQHSQTEQSKPVVKRKSGSRGLTLKIIVALVLLGFFVLWIDASYMSKGQARKKEDNRRMKSMGIRQKKVRKKMIKQKL